MRLLNILRKRAVRLTLAGAATALLLFTVSGYFVLPFVISSQAESLVKEKFQRKLTIGGITLNPFALTLALRDVRLLDAEGKTVFAALEALHVNLAYESLWRLAPVVQELRLTRPDVHVVRTAAGRYNFDDIIERLAKEPPSAKPARFSVNNIQIEDGHIRFEDRPAGVTHVVTNLQLGVPFVSSLPSDVQVFVEPLVSARINNTPLHIKGKARPFAEPKDAVVELDFDDLDVTRFLEYLPVKPQARISGAKLDLRLKASFQQPADKAPALLLTGDATLKSLHVADPGGRPVLKLPRLAVSLRDADVFGGRIELARILIDGLDAEVVRDSGGQLSVMRLLPDSAPAPAGSTTKTNVPVVAIGEVEVRRATLRYADEAPSRPLTAGMEKLDLAVRKVTVDPGRKTVSIGEVVSAGAAVLLKREKPEQTAVATAAVATAAAASTSASAPPAQQSAMGSPYRVSIGRVAVDNWSVRLEDRSRPEPVVTRVAPLSLSLRELSTASGAATAVDIRATVNEAGQLTVGGTAGIAPLQADLAVDMKNIDILPLQPYIADRINLRLTRASLSGRGKLQLASGNDGALRGGFKGDMTVGNVAAVDKATGTDFARWKSLFLGGVDLRIEPFALAVEQVTLADFFTRIGIDSTGRINLQDIVRAGTAPAPAEPQPQRTAQTTKASPIKIGKLTLQSGRVRFTDNFIKPNYTATLGNFNGVVTDLSSDAATNAKVELRGEVNNAPLSVNGRINPLKGELFLDLKAAVRGMELAPLSAYSGRYIGYGIEKGKLSFEVAYKVDQRVLTADNRLILEQLTFGDPVNSPDGTRLPVRFAVALLSDRNGVIDVKLPIGGSLDDPQFSIGAVIFKAIGNAVTKAVTQPFALLGSLFGGGEELSSLEFQPGRFAVPAGGEEKLRSLASALTNRPSLKLEITGRADLQTDRDGLKHAAIERKVRALKIRDMAARGASIEPGRVTVSAAEYPALLARVYKDEDFTKPRNMIGLAKELPVEEMEKLMIANAVVADDDLHTLGNQRAQAAKTWLVRNGKVPDERIFIVAAKVGNQGGSGDSSSNQLNRVDFSLR
jgi:uncharacterized protein involved in outer membrane biogenesis